MNGRCNGSSGAIAPIPWLDAPGQSRTAHALGFCPQQRRTILELARGKYAGCNDSHLCEKLHAAENLGVSRETVRRILRSAHLASPQKRRPRQYRAPPLAPSPLRHDGVTDASRHDWLEGRIGWQE